MARSADALDSERDIVPELLAVVAAVVPEMSPAQRDAIALEWQMRFAGVRTRFAKRKRHPTSEERAKVFTECLTDAPTDKILSDNGISRRSLYRYLKRGG